MKLSFFNHNWDHVSMWTSDHRYHLDGFGNCYVQHNEANKESWVEVMSEDDARQYFVNLIHKGWQQRKYLNSWMQELVEGDA